MFPLPYLALFALIAVGAAFGGGWHYGQKLANAACEQERQAILAEETKKQDRLRAEMADAEDRAASARAREVVRWKYINKEVERVVKEPVYSSPDCRLTPDGVRIWNSAAGVVRVADSKVQADAVSGQPAVAEGRGYVGGLAVSGGDKR